MVSIKNWYEDPLLHSWMNGDSLTPPPIGISEDGESIKVFSSRDALSKAMQFKTASPEEISKIAEKSFSKAPKHAKRMIQKVISAILFNAFTLQQKERLRNLEQAASSSGQKQAEDKVISELFASYVQNSQLTFKALKEAVEQEDIKWLRELVEEINTQGTSKIFINHQDEQGNTLLHLAAKSKCDQSFVELLNLCPLLDVNARNKEGKTALHLAIEYNPTLLTGSGFINATKLLLQNHVDPTIQDNQGQTALHTAVKKGEIETIEVLLEHSKMELAQIRDYEGSSARELALVSKKEDVIALLDKFRPSSQDISKAFDILQMAIKATIKGIREKHPPEAIQSSVRLAKAKYHLLEEGLADVQTNKQLNFIPVLLKDISQATSQENVLKLEDAIEKLSAAKKTLSPTAQVTSVEEGLKEEEEISEAESIATEVDKKAKDLQSMMPKTIQQLQRSFKAIEQGNFGNTFKELFISRSEEMFSGVAYLRMLLIQSLWQHQGKNEIDPTQLPEKLRAPTTIAAINQLLRNPKVHAALSNAEVFKQVTQCLILNEAPSQDIQEVIDILKAEMQSILATTSFTIEELSGINQVFLPAFLTESPSLTDVTELIKVDRPFQAELIASKLTDLDEQFAANFAIIMAYVEAKQANWALNYILTLPTDTQDAALSAFELHRDESEQLGKLEEIASLLSPKSLQDRFSEMICRQYIRKIVHELIRDENYQPTLERLKHLWDEIESAEIKNQVLQYQKKILKVDLLSEEFLEEEDEQ